MLDFNIVPGNRVVVNLKRLDHLDRRIKVAVDPFCEGIVRLAAHPFRGSDLDMQTVETGIVTRATHVINQLLLNISHKRNRLQD